MRVWLDGDGLLVKFSLRDLWTRRALFKMLRKCGIKTSRREVREAMR